MTVQVGGNTKRCGTCEFWTGSRTTNLSGIDVVFENDTAKGRCIGRWKGSEYDRSHDCTEWKKWGVLK